MFRLIIITFILLFSSNFAIAIATFCFVNGSLTCPNGLNVDYPFMNSMDNCGYPEFMILCSIYGEASITISNHTYSIQNIDFSRKKISVVDVEIERPECPRPLHNFTLDSKHLLDYDSPGLKNLTVFYNCSSFPPNYASRQHLNCLDYNTKRSFAFGSTEIPKSDWFRNCEKSVVVPVSFFPSPSGQSYSGFNYTETLKAGFQLKWSTPSDHCKACENSGGKCLYNQTSSNYGCVCEDKTLESGEKLVHGICSHTADTGIITRLKKFIIGVFAGVGGLLLILLLVYRKRLSTLYYPISYWRNKIKSPTNVEVFLENYGYLTLQRYRYSQIKRMTNNFKDKLGQGGYGGVFKGKLPDGRLVAVKVLSESKGNGEDFINEVATIGRTNHINVVTLLGFYTVGSKRALVYEFMPNGSLERFIYNEKKSSLGWEKLYQIALGIARGLEYLHQGCNTRILHFDIKPHNILLDQDFRPKISDFGLAKLCPTRESVVSVLGARGTIGYIAPEVCCRNFGGVSYKSDVYSYGMMVLEMIGGRKNIDATVENISEIYFPQWIYNRLERDFELGGSGEIFNEEMTRKMIIVGLSCIQTHPTNRPSMTKVVEMLEGRIEELEMPPNPFPNPSSS